MPEGPQNQTAHAAQLPDASSGREAAGLLGNTRIWGYVIYAACCVLAVAGIVATAWAVASALAHTTSVSWAGVGIMAVIIVGIWAAGRAALYFLSDR